MQVEGKVIVCDAIDEIGITILKKAGLIVDYKPEIEPDDLLTTVGESNVIIVRSRTKITKKVIDAAPNVKIIARVGVGLDNIDTEYAESKGIKVLNAAEAAMNAGIVISDSPAVGPDAINLISFDIFINSIAIFLRVEEHMVVSNLLCKEKK